MEAPVIAIDGPSASGKSSTAGAVARALGFTHLDSGALYRGVTFVAIQDCGALPGGSLDPGAILRAVERRGLALQSRDGEWSAVLDGTTAEDRIRTAEVTALVSAVAALPEVRAWVNQQVRTLARRGEPMVVDGRDIGTTVFPEAILKVFLTAAPGERAERRLRQRGDRIDPGLLARETAALAARDEADTRRAVAPLRRAPDAVLVDGSDLTFDQQVARIVALARERIPLP